MGYEPTCVFLKFSAESRNRKLLDEQKKNISRENKSLGGVKIHTDNQTNMSDKTGNEHNLIVRIETDEYIYEEYSEV